MSFVDEQIQTIPKCYCCKTTPGMLFWGTRFVCGGCAIKINEKYQLEESAKRLSIVESVKVQNGE